MSEFAVSVVIPVYNAEKYLKEAVASALAQPETAEVILIEDASPDNALAICEALVQEDPRVKLYRHPDGKNMGAGPSRNLGIEKAQSDFVAFLDADDFYLPGVFEKPREILTAQPDIDGVYGALGVHYNDEAAKQAFKGYALYQRLTAMTEIIPPERLFTSMTPCSSKGNFHLNTLVVRKTIFAKSGVFGDLRLSQDTHLRMRMAATSRLMAGVIDKPIAMRRVHMENRVHDLNKDEHKALMNRICMMSSLVVWAREINLEKSKRKYLERCTKRQIRHHLRRQCDQQRIRNINLRTLSHPLWWYKRFPFILESMAMTNPEILGRWGVEVPTTAG